MDDDFLLRSSVAGQISELERDALYSPDDGNLKERTAAMERAAGLAEETFGEEHWLTVISRSLADGMKSVSILPAMQRELFDDAMTAQLKGCRLASEGKRDAALKEFRKSHEKRVAAIGPDHILTIYFQADLCENEYRLGAMELAKAHAIAMAPVAALRWGKDHPAYADVLRTLALAECELQEHEVSISHLNQVLSILEPVIVEGLSSSYTQAYATAHFGLAKMHNERGEFAEAEAPARRAVELLAAFSEDMRLETFGSLLELARSENGQGKVRQADLTFAPIRHVPWSELPPALAESFKAAHEERARRARPVAKSDASGASHSAVKK